MSRDGDVLSACSDEVLWWRLVTGSNMELLLRHTLGNFQMIFDRETRGNHGFKNGFVVLSDQ